jgi:hypothetical protein
LTHVSSRARPAEPPTKTGEARLLELMRQDRHVLADEVDGGKANAARVKWDRVRRAAKAAGA